jgi:hypothetical protein
VTAVAIESLLRSCRHLSERLYPEGTGHAVAIWTSGPHSWHCAISFISSLGAEESPDCSSSTVYAALLALEGWLEDALVEKRSEVA